MAEWDEYISELLVSQSDIDGIAVSLDGGKTSSMFPAIIKASVLMLDQMLEHGRHNVFVFPERTQSLFLFMIAKLLHNIYLGKINYGYDFGKFKPGDRVKIGNAVAEFAGVVERDGTTRVKIRLSDLFYEAPMELLPYFQQTDTKRRLSTDSSFQKERKAIQAKLKTGSMGDRAMASLSEYKTHMDSSLAFVSTISTARVQIANCLLQKQPISDVVLVGQAEYDGNIKSVGPGQLAGVPALLLSPDLYSLQEAYQTGVPLQSIIIDATNSSILEGQGDVLDSLMRKEMPIAVVASTVDSFDFALLEERGFKIWRWNEDCIVPRLYGAGLTPVDRKTRACARQSVSFINVNCQELSDAILVLNKHRQESELFSPGMAKVFDDMYSLTFSAIRESAGFSQEAIDYTHRKLEEGLKTLLNEQRYISEGSFEDFGKAITDLGCVYATNYTLPKQKAIKEHLLEKRYQKVCMIVSERTIKNNVEQYWRSWLEENDLVTQLDVYYPGEYYLLDCELYEATIVVGWLKRAIMRKVLFSYNTDNYVVLLYECERGWKNYSLGRWQSQIGGGGNKDIANRCLELTGSNVHLEQGKSALSVDQHDVPQQDELGEVEQAIKGNRLRRYASHSGAGSGGNVEAIPVSFVGDYMMFYRVGHKAIVITKIVNGESDRIETKQPSELVVGDFVAVRESDRDIIKELADKELEESGEGHLRELSGKWRDALKIETVFASLEVLYERLQDAGCDRGFQTVRNWLCDEDLIAPQSKSDLELIALVTDNAVLEEKVDEIFAAAQRVKAAHVRAGQKLSQLFREKISEALGDYGEIDAFNIWKPIDLYVEGIGMVRLLKIIDIGSAITVDFSNTNRLIEE